MVNKYIILYLVDKAVAINSYNVGQQKSEGQQTGQDLISCPDAVGFVLLFGFVPFSVKPAMHSGVVYQPGPTTTCNGLRMFL